MRHPDERSADARPGAGGPGGSTHADEGTIHAWLDDALPPAEAAALERHVAECAACRAQVAEARGLLAATSRILAALDDVPGGVLPGADGQAGAAGTAGAAAAASVTTPDGVRPLRPAAATRPRARWRGWRVQAAAAVALLAVGTTTVLRRTPDDSYLADSSMARETAAVSAFGAPGTGGAASQPEVPPLALPPVAPEGVAAEEERRTGGDASARALADASPAAAQKTLARAEVQANTGARAGAPPGGLVFPPIVPPVLPPVPPGREAVALRAPVQMPLAFAQTAGHDERGVAGRVVTAGSGAPVGGATVSVPAAGRSTVTDSTGRFSLGALPPGSYTGAVRRIGFAPGRVELTVRDSASPPTVEVALQPVASELERVVTTGAAAQRAGTDRAAADRAAGERTVAERAVAAISPQAAAAPPAVARGSAAAGALAGCYTLELGGGEVAALRAVERTLPGILWLLSSAAEDHPGWLAVTSGASRGARPVPGARWRAPAADAVELIWSAGAAPLRLVLTATGDGLSGSAVLLQDDGASTGDRGAVRLTAQRRACPES